MGISFEDYARLLAPYTAPICSYLQGRNVNHWYFVLTFQAYAINLKEEGNLPVHFL